MANLDSRVKRASSLSTHIRIPIAPTLPDSELDHYDRAHITSSYAGLIPTALTMSVSDRPGSHTQEFAVGDILLLKALAEDGTIGETWLHVIAATDQTSYWDYTVARLSGDEKTYPRGTSIVNYGASGEGVIRNILTGSYPPYIEALDHAGDPWSSVTAHAVLGNLEEFTGQSEYGIAVGADLTSLTGDYAILSESRALFNVDVSLATGKAIYSPDSMQNYVLKDVNGDGRFVPAAEAGGGGALPTPTGEGYILRSNSVPQFVEYLVNADGQILVGNGTTINSVAVSGDITLDNAGATEVVAIRGYSVQDHAPIDGEILKWSDSNNRYEPSSDLVGSGTVEDPTAQGSVLISNATPEWEELAHPGSQYRYLQSTASILEWGANIPLSDEAYVGIPSGGRIKFNDEATDELELLACKIIVGADDANIPTTDLKQIINGSLCVWVEGSSGVTFSGYAYGSGADDHGRLALRKSRGTQASPSAVAQYDILGRFGAAGYGAAFPTASTGAMEVVATEAWDGSSYGTEMLFYTTPNGSTTTREVASLRQDGILESLYGIHINETISDNCTLGITINQGENDDFIAVFKSSPDVSHLMTAEAEADTYGAFGKATAASGGLLALGLTEATTAFRINGYGTTPNTTKTAAGRAYIELNAAERSGTGVGAATANANLVAFMNNGSAVALIDAEGDVWADGTWNAFDEYDDIALLDALEAGFALHQGNPIDEWWAHFAKRNRSRLERLKLARFRKGGGSLNTTQLAKLLVGAVRQNEAEIQGIQEILLAKGIDRRLLGAP